MENEIGDYYWSSYYEHTGIRNEVFLNKSPVQISKSEWRTYLIEGLGDHSFIEIINTGTYQGKSISKITLKNG
jgi:hypothetical protein